MAIYTYKDCEIEHDGYAYTWAHKDYSGPNDDDDYTSLEYYGSHPELKEVYGQIDEFSYELEGIE